MSQLILFYHENYSTEIQELIMTWMCFTDSVLVLLVTVSADTGIAWLLLRLNRLINPLEKLFGLCVCCVAGTRRESSLRRSSSEMSILLWYRMYINKWKKCIYIGCVVWVVYKCVREMSGLCMICQSRV